MSIVSQHLQNLLGEKDVHLWGGYVNMLKVLESMFLSPKHWILEFLQNAEDATAARISIRLGEASLLILNDGNTFMDDDFYAICDVNSRKLPSLGFRGYIGIGFKSIFRITNRIDVHSGDFHFCFDKEHWGDSMRRGTPIASWPWEILPSEIPPIELQEGYTTVFSVPLGSIKGQEVLEEIGKFLASNDFPKEAILLLQKVGVIEVQTPQLSFTITKETVELETLPIGQKELVIARKQVTGQQYSEEDLYLVFRNSVEVPDDIRQDTETERVRRSEITKREIGLVFSLDAEKNLQALSGKLAGVYSFLPVEGEQTGLPFGIFGDFIPQPGRDLINYGAKWNHWMCDKVAEFFKHVVVEVFLTHPPWRFFPAELLDSVQYSSISGPGKEFWDTKLRNPIKEFLEREALYPDEEGIARRLSELVIVADEVIKVVGKETLEALIGKKIAHASIKGKIRSKVEVIEEGDLWSRRELLDHLKGQPEKLAEVSIETVYNMLYSREMLEPLRDQPERLAATYHRIAGLNDYRITGRQGRDPMPLCAAQFVLADDGEFYSPDKVATLQVDLDLVPNFLKAVIPTEKKFLHPEIAKEAEAVRQLERCGMEILDEDSVIQNVQHLVNTITNPEMCPQSWQYPDDLIEATLFLISRGKFSGDRLVTQDGSLQVPRNTFVSEAPLDWSSLWKNDFLPGFHPVHQKYFDMKGEYEMQLEKIYQCLEELSVHGFRPDKDKRVIELTAYKIATKKLEEKGHTIADVHGQTELGYDLECQGHCTKVFEVKGMAEPENVSLEESEFTAAQQKKDDYILVCVYNLPSHPECKEITNPQTMCEAVEKAKIRKDRWLME